MNKKVREEVSRMLTSSCARLYNSRQIYNSSTAIWLHMMTAALSARHQLTFLRWPVMMAIWLIFSLSLPVRGDCGASMTWACPQSHQTIFIRAAHCSRCVFPRTLPSRCVTWFTKEMICWNMMVLQNGPGCLPAWYLQLLSRQIAGQCVLLMHILSKTMHCQEVEPEIRAFKFIFNLNV